MSKVSDTLSAWTDLASIAVLGLIVLDTDGVIQKGDSVFLQALGRPASELPLRWRDVARSHWRALPVPSAGDGQTASQFCVVVGDQIRRSTSIPARTSRAGNRVLCDSIPVMYFRIGSDGTILTVSKHGALRLGYERRELIGMPLFELFHPDDRYAVSEQFVRVCRATGRVTKWEARKVCKDGKVICVRETVAPMIDESGRTIVLVVSEDITQDKVVERDLERHQRDVRDLAARLVVTEEKERRRLARDLHDRVGHSLAIARRHVSDLRDRSGRIEGIDLDAIGELLDQVISDTRAVTFDLSPPALYELGLDPAVRALGDRMSSLGGFEFRLDVEIGKGLPNGQETVVAYRIIRELLMNVVKHAGAGRVRVGLASSRAALFVSVEDDGKGFDVEAQLGCSQSLGLYSIREQIRHLGGSISMWSVRESGTRTVLTVPVSSFHKPELKWPAFAF